MATTTKYDSGEVKELAVMLDVAMALDLVAQERYEAIYGIPWEPLVDTLVFVQRKSHDISTTANTSVSAACALIDLSK